MNVRRKGLQLTDLLEKINDYKGITEDSRKVSDGFIFVAVKGVNFDGTSYIDDAIKKGVRAIVTHDWYDNKLPDNIILLKEKNPRFALSKLASAFYPKQPKNIAAVTGTNGKTSTVNFYRQIVDLVGKKSASIGTIGIIDSNNKSYETSGSMTTPDPVTLHQKIQELAVNGIEYLALEASSHGLDQYRLDGVKITCAGFTNFTRDHLDYHKTMENYLDAKLRLFSQLLGGDATAVINADIPEFTKIKELSEKRKIKVISFGKNSDSIKLISIKPTSYGQEIVINIDGKSYSLKLSLVGDFQVSNLLCALGLVIASGIKASDAIGVLEKVKNVPGRMERVADINSLIQVFVDYAHTPDGLEKALETLKLHTKGKLYVVFGCGGNRDKGKRVEMGKIASNLADYVVITDDNPRNENPAEIRKEVMAGCGKNATEVGGREEAINYTVAKLNKGDILLIAGKGHEKIQIIGEKSLSFDDVVVARKALERIGV